MTATAPNPLVVDLIAQATNSLCFYYDSFNVAMALRYATGTAPVIFGTGYVTLKNGGV